MKDIFKEKEYTKVLLICALMAAGNLGVPNAYGLFYAPMSEIMNCGMGEVTMHMTVCLIVCAFATPLVVRKYRSIGMNRMIMIGSLMILLSGIVIGFSKNPMLNNIVAIIRGIGLSASCAVFITMVIGNWFYKAKGSITGFVMGFSGITGALLSPVIGASLEIFGFEITYIGSIVLQILCFMPAVLWLKEKPEDANMKPYGADDSKEDSSVKSHDYPFTMNSIVFMALALGVICLNMLPTIASHISAYVLNIGFSVTDAAMIVSVVMVANVLFKIVIGSLCDAIGVFKTIMLVLIVCGTSVLLMSMFTGSAIMLYIIAFFYGICYSACSVSFSLYVREVYGDENYGKAMSTFTMFGSISYSAVITIIGFLYDLSGSYRLPFTIIAFMAVISVLSFITAEKTVNKKA